MPPLGKRSCSRILQAQRPEEVALAQRNAVVTEDRVGVREVEVEVRQGVLEEVVAAAPDYWRPKTVVAAKAGPAKSTVVNAAETGKVDDKNKH